MSKILIIAEAGVNHNGSIDQAKALITAAADAGADIVKFQTFNANSLVTADAPKAEYQSNNTDSSDNQLEMVKKLELSPEMHSELIKHAESCDIQFLSTAFDLESIELLRTLGISLWKIPSGEITNLPYLRAIGSLGEPIILSTGMSNIQEIKDAVQALCEEGASMADITLLHCNTEYPTPMQDANLCAIHTLRSEFPDTKVGYSDHTAGIEAPIAAVALGATVIEKHFTIDRSLPGPDHKASLEPDELSRMILAIRNIDLAMGDGIKQASESESKNKAIARRSIVASCPIKAGEVFSEDNLTAKRPGTGISPMKWDEVIGNTALRDYNQDDMIEQ